MGAPPGQAPGPYGPGNFAPPGQPYPPPPGPGYGWPQQGYGHPAYGARYRSPPKQRIAYVLLGLFIGTLGIHNFYAGYHGRAIAQLLITLLIGWWLIIPIFCIWIWNIIEICVVDRDADGVPMT